MKPQYAKNLIKTTKQYFNENAKNFSQSREKPWPEFEELKKYIEPNTKILDLGCGNGRLFELFSNKQINYTGVDFSKQLIKIAQQKYGNHFKTSSMFSLPFSNNSFDSIWSIAVFHHIPSEKLRIKTLNEAKRVLKPNGKIIITCWYLYGGKYLKILLKFTLSKLLGLTKLDFKDILISPKTLKIKRYYHAFTKKELKKLLKKAGLKVEKLQYLKRNNNKTNILIVAKNV